MDQLIFASLSHTHYWYEVGMLKVPIINILLVALPIILTPVSSRKDFMDALEIPTRSLDSATSTEGQGTGNPSFKDSSK